MSLPQIDNDASARGAGPNVRQHRVDDYRTSAGPRDAILAAIRHAIRTRSRKWLVASALLVGLIAAVAMMTTGQLHDRTFAALSNPVQSLMSVMVPLLGILLVRDLKQAPRPTPVLPTLIAATLVAAVIGVFGVLICAAALAFTPSSAAQNPWVHVGTVAVGSVLVQVVAQLVGTALGLLLRSAVVAFLASIVLPLGLWLVLGSIDVLRAIQAWLTPYAAVQNLLSGQMSGSAWTQWFAVFLVWGVGLNVIGATRLRR